MDKKKSNIELEKQLEELKKRDQKRLNQLIKNSFDMLVLLDTNGNQHFVSESCERILGFKPEELVNIPVIEQMVHPEDKDQVFEGFRDIIKNKSNGGAQYRHRHKNGSWVYLEAFGTNQIDNPLIESIVLNVRDITERKKIEKDLLESKARLSEANATKDRFFSIIAHDLRSPFNSILGFSNLLAERIRDKNYDGIEEFVRIIEQSSNRAMSLLMNLMEWSRSQTGRIEFNPEYFEMKSFIDETLLLFEKIAEQKTISIIKKLPANVPVFADKEMVSTILRNLISNAIKFTNTGGEIIISTSEDKEELTVSVSDNGVGISEENLEKIFNIDENYSTSGTNKEKGTGLGLMLCQEFVKKHEGNIWVESEEGKGSRFHFTIPIIINY